MIFQRHIAKNMFRFFSISLILFPLIVHSQDANEILAGMDKVIFGPKDKEATMTVVLKSRSGKEKIREAQMLQKGPDRKVFRYTQPESQAGIATLSLPNDIMWLYMPAFGKPKKISLLAKSQKFTGTDFSHEDMATQPYADRYTPVLLSSGSDSYQLELKPISEKSQYSKIVVTLNKTHFYPITMEYYNRGGKKSKEANYKYSKIGKYWNADEVVMKDLKSGHSTSISLQDVKFDQGLSDDLFTVENLKQ